MKTVQLRSLIRWIHLLGAAAIGTYVYAPWRGSRCSGNCSSFLV